MTLQRYYFIFLTFFFINACFPQEHISQKTSTDESNVVIYLQPMPQEASQIRFEIAGIFAVRDDGLPIPLSLSINEIKGSDLTQLQKRLATGWLPEGLYTGISIKVEKAFLPGEEGEFSLLVPEEPVAVEHLFKVTRKNAQTLFLSFNPKGAIAADGVRFTPGFSLAPSLKGLINFTGYVSNSDSNSITVFNKKTMQVIDTISTGRKPKGMVLDKRRGQAFVAVSEDDAVEVIDVLYGKIVDRIKLRFRDEPIDLALTPDGRTLVSVNHGSNTVSIIDAISRFEITRINVGKGPVSAVVDPRGLRAYIMDSLSNTVSVVDLFQKVFSASIGIEGAPLRGAFNRNGDRLYVISPDSPNLTVIDPSSLTVTQKVFIGTGAVSIKVNTRTDLILAGKKAGGEISVIDPFSLMSIDSITVMNNAAFMTIDDDENSLFVVFPDGKILQKINLTSKKVVAEIEVDVGAYAVVVMGER
ncbi:MAG: hypothetical protein E4H16_02725 [Candidatus Atribacteria bacterium]|nr:MAG: hypothetical protein E4H16_02725 [Candidatus Atribacteria bacterium]